ncbi:MAG TPA: hypothetical protein VGP53_10570 [Acidimicrobiales bacterium]|nr:hypothetical protein [Acidimicrobiales bacterium]
MLTDVQVVPGTTAVARFGEVLAWFEAGPDGGGAVLTQLLQATQGVASGSVPSGQVGARLAAVLNGGDATSVPALVAAAPEGEGLRVVVHGWGAVAADGVHLPNGWADEHLASPGVWFLGRNTAVARAPVAHPTLRPGDGVVPGDGLRFGLTATPPAPPLPQDPAPGRLVLDDGSMAVLARTCVLGSAPQLSPAVQSGAATPLTVGGAGVAAVHAEIHLGPGQVGVVALGTAVTYLLEVGAHSWVPLAAGALTPLAPGARIALGPRTISYQQP